MAKYTGVEATLKASHAPKGERETHEHTWHVVAWFLVAPDALPIDKNDRLAQLEMLLRPLQGHQLSEDVSWAEDLAERIGAMLGCASVCISRPDESHRALWTDRP
jgi:hypothetical protein